MQTRDGKLRAAIPSPIGSCKFLNDVDYEVMLEALRRHKEVMKSYPRNGEGLEASVDSSDTGYTVNSKPVEGGVKAKNIASKSLINDDAKDGISPDGLKNGTSTSAPKNAVNAASGPEGVDGVSNGTNGLANGSANGVKTNGHH